tara:strand:- start:618 stop:1445 length:828 start_codon:yes stop_codon:yes gene_type:complete
MASTVKVNNITTESGSTITVGESGKTIALDTNTAVNLPTGSVTNAELAGSIENAKLSNSAITINGSPVSLGGSVTVGETKPTVSGVSPSTIENTATSVVITGTNFVSIPQVEAISSTGAVTAANTVTFTSSTSITANFTLAVDGTYFIRVENNDGNAVRSSSALLTVSDAPSWTTSAGSLGSIAGDFSGTVATVAATGDTVTFSETTSVLTNAAQANCSLNSSTGVITTSDFGGSSSTPTLYSFTLRATDAQGQTADRAFTLQSTFGATGGSQFN